MKTPGHATPDRPGREGARNAPARFHPSAYIVITGAFHAL